MGTHLNYSYVVNKLQNLPEIMIKNDFVIWDWNKGELEWGYPLSVDGHLFGKDEIEVLASMLSYTSPNSFEEALHVFKNVFSSRIGMSYSKALIFNNPCNKVQKDVENFHGEMHQDILLKYWNEGKQINYKAFYGYINKSVHEEVNISLISRYDT